MSDSKNKLNPSRNWNNEEKEFLNENWGKLSITGISNRLGRTVNAVKLKSHRMGLGNFLEAGDYITINQLFKVLRGRSYAAYTLNQWIEKGLPVVNKKRVNESVRVINLDDFWKWAKKNKTLINFSKLEENILGKEPEWLKEQRRADQQNSKYKKTKWTESEDKRLKDLVESYCYGYKDISSKLRRTEGAIKRRLCDLNIKARPLKKPNHNPWKSHEVQKLKNLYCEGYTPEVIREHVDRSAQAVRGKIERMIIEGDLKPRSQFRKTC